MSPLERIKLKLVGYFSDTLKSEYIEPIIILQEKKNIIFLQKKNEALQSFTSEDGVSFSPSKVKCTLPKQVEQFPHLAIIPQTKISAKKLQMAYFGDRTIHFATSLDGKKWEAYERALIVHARPIEVGAVFVRKEGILLLYFEKQITQGILYYSAHVALFDKENPSVLLWHTTEPLWKHKDIWMNKTAFPIGSIFLDEKIIMYWYVGKMAVYSVALSGFLYDPNSIKKKGLQLEKHIANPIISPQAENDWEAFNTMNPAAVYAGNKVHILYRAQGYDYISTVGYAASKDGVIIDTRLDQPIYTPRMDFENNHTGKVNPDLMSGGGYGGCEDPRVTLLGDRVYMTYVAFNGWSSIRLALTSISLNDFLAQRWNWSKPILISRPGVIDKSGCLLPEKIDGKFVFFHRIFPNILIDYVDTLNFNGTTGWLKGQFEIKIRKDKWDSRKIGAGAPPIKTKDGWLLIYYGVDDRDASKYHIGAMLLDLKRPEKVLYRTDSPILQPTESYENEGFKPGIAYPCGAVLVKDEIMVYYGGADSVVCVATAKLDTFLRELKSSQPVHLHNIQIKEIVY
ncbi:MAG: hypothetical protein NTV98_00470 [Candidatus Roizmanbacteria bacterium]|nr:hypothetical protein [Candidatus Roizmanbacteria bacterium]